MGNKNTVINGDHNGRRIELIESLVFIRDEKFGFGRKVFIDKDTVESYEVMTNEHQKSSTSATDKAATGGLLLAPIRLLAEVLAKNTKDHHFVTVRFKDGDQSLLEVDSKVYQAIVSALSEQPTSKTLSTADEIRNFKELLDDGIITEDEFNAKKKQLLGL